MFRLDRSHIAGRFGPLSLLVSVATLLASCQNPSNQSTEEEYPDSAFVKPVEGQPVTTGFTTKTGKVFEVTQISIGASLTNVTVVPKGFSEDNAIVGFEEIDPIIRILQADLDKNDFEELYLITQAAGSGSYSTIYGLNSNNDKSVSEIYFEGPTPYNSKKGEPYEGYLGHDRFELLDSVLVNTFPVFREGDSNDNPTGGKRKVFYALVQGEASWQLKPIRSEEVK